MPNTRPSPCRATVGSSGYFIGADEYEAFRRFRDSRRSFATAELSEERVGAIGASRMDARHTHLDRMLDPNSGVACQFLSRNRAS